ncbi:hypothetical protein B0T19DRAFT_457562 [Cercophora scortea]|uniref:Uncharacterized protein n=1 Tax=Cercophora scortea TaxID=314031 RepID=A0AAE0MIA1_9PEZI|nr:hypothetical protein B0T19DRAFT_457562 [Cercophora scortea]
MSQSTPTHPAYEAISGSPNPPHNTHDLIHLLWDLSGPIVTSIRPECWEILHEVHYCDDDDGQEFEPDVLEGSEYLTPRLIHCYYTERPRPPSPVVVRTSTYPFVTIHDYVMTVHPWLMGLKDAILPAMSAMEGREVTENTILVVDPLRPAEIRLLDSPPSGSRVRQVRAEMAGRVQGCKTAAARRAEAGNTPVAVQERAAAGPVDAETARAMWANQPWVRELEEACLESSRRAFALMNARHG